jgi:hypothetical protein
MIPALTCLLVPFFGGCSAYVRDVPAIPAVLRREQYYTGKVMSVTGRVERLHQWRLRNGSDAEVFAVCAGGCIQVFVFAHSPIHNGQLVSVSGRYYQAFHTGEDTYYNEIEGTGVLPRE